jgi:hypothetical protein
MTLLEDLCIIGITSGDNESNGYGIVVAKLMTVTGHDSDCTMEFQPLISSWIGSRLVAWMGLFLVITLVSNNPIITSKLREYRSFGEIGNPFEVSLKGSWESCYNFPFHFL